MNRFSTQQNGMTNSFFLHLAFIAFWKRALHILIRIFILAQDDRLYHNIIANDVIITLGHKRTDEPFFGTGSLKRTVRKNQFAEKNRTSHHYSRVWEPNVKKPCILWLAILGTIKSPYFVTFGSRMDCSMMYN